MSTTNSSPIYARIAYDIALKIATGQLAENEKFSGRSMMSSQYQVSPETIRRALGLLANMGIIEIQEHVGSRVVSRHRAEEYVSHAALGQNLSSLKQQLGHLLAQRRQLDRRIESTIEQITDLSDRFQSSNGLHSYERELRRHSHLIGKSIRETDFRNKTDATIVAIRRDEEIFLSPDPLLVLQEGDILVVASELSKVDHLISFIDSPA